MGVRVFQFHLIGCGYNHNSIIAIIVLAIIVISSSIVVGIISFFFFISSIVVIGACASAKIIFEDGFLASNSGEDRLLSMISTSIRGNWPLEEKKHLPIGIFFRKIGHVVD